MGMLKVGGLASGLDTEGLIQQLLSLERRPLVRMDQRREQMNTEANAWRDLNSRLLNLENRLADLKGLAATVWEAKRVTVADQSVLTAATGATAQPGIYAVETVALATAAIWQSGRSDIADPDTALGVSGSIRLAGGVGDGEAFAIAADASLNAIASTINNDSARLGIRASVIQVNPGDYRLILTGQTGVDNQFTLEDADGGTAAADLMLDAGGAISVTAAANGTIKVNSVTITVASNTVTDAIPGVTMTLQKAGGTTNVTVARDDQKVVEAVKGLVDQYNSVMDFIEQQGKYDSKTKQAGPLFAQGMVQSIQSHLNGRMTSPVNGLPNEFQTLGMIGISTERFSEGGTVSRKLKFNESTFKEALGKDPDAVRGLFTRDDGTGKGIAVRAEEWLHSYTRSGGLVPSKADSLESEITRIKERVARFEEVLIPMKEERLRKQFTALEKAISTMQGQGDWLAMQINSLNQTAPGRR